MFFTQHSRSMCEQIVFPTTYCDIIPRCYFRNRVVIRCRDLGRGKVERFLCKQNLNIGESEVRSVMSNSLWPHGLHSPWNSPGQNTGVDSLSLLQGIFPTQGLNPGLPHCRWILYQLSHKGNPRILEWVAYPFSGDLPDTGIKPGSPALQADSLPTELWRKPYKGLWRKCAQKHCNIAMSMSGT